MADVLAAKSTIQDAVVEGTNAKQGCTWFRYKHYLLIVVANTILSSN